MKICAGCDRHLFGPEPACPFCGAPQRTVSATGFAASGRSAAASVVLALSLGAVACGPPLELETTAEDSSSAAETSTTAPSPTTGGPTSSDDGPAMTTIASSSSGLDSSDDSPGSFYAVRPDLDTSLECDLFAQDCPEGEKCMPWANDSGSSWNATRCSPIANNPGQEDDPCQVEGSGVSGLDDCDEGLMCFEVDPETNEGTCFSLCGGTPDEPTCPGADQVCSITSDGLLTLCLDTCDPLMSTCVPGFVCIPFNEGFACAPAFGNGAYGEACSFINDCAPGHACLATSSFPDCTSGSCCTEYCDLTAPETCPEAVLHATCQPWYPAGTAPPGLENLGVCALP